jgi:AcrR family transcriptional regulator
MRGSVGKQLGSHSPQPNRKPSRKRSDRYHHGDLRQALLAEALRTIHTDGVGSLTLRAVAEKLGVSRTAMYRHFSDKQALLAAVGREGFRLLRLALHDAWHQNGRGIQGFEAMGLAYVQFAVAHPSHYRVMFGRFLESCARDAAFIDEATSAFKVLVNSLAELQQSGLVRRDDPIMLARFIWAVVHGISMLVIDGQLRGLDERGEALNRYAVERIRDAVKAV